MEGENLGKNKFIENIKYNGYIYLIILDIFLVNLFKIPTHISMLLKIISGIILINDYFKNNFSKKKIMLFCIFILIILLNFNQLKLNLLYIYLFINTKNKLKNIEMSILTGLLGLFILNILLLKFGVIKNITTFYGGRIRESFGFSNSNAVSIFYFYIIAYLWRYKNIYLKIVVIFFAYFIYLKTDSRTQFFGFLILILVIFLFENIFKKILKKQNVIRIKKFLIGIIFLLNYVYLFLGVNSGKFYEINRLLSYRLSYVEKTFLELNILECILGSNEAIKFPIDNSLIVTNYSVGIILGNILFIYIFLIIFKNIKKYSDYRYGIIVSCLIMGLFESFLLRLSIPITILFYTTIYNRETTEIVQKKEKGDKNKRIILRGK